MKRFIITVLFIGAGLFLIGCSAEPIKYTGGGTLDSITKVEGEKANVGFVLNNCKDPAHLRFIYQDKFAYGGDGLKMKGGEILEFDHFNGVKVSYISMSKGSAGEDGEMWIILVDEGEGNGDHGSVDINVISGPFAGYENFSFISGNVQEHECNDECDYR